MPKTKTVWTAGREENTFFDEWEPVFAIVDESGEADWTTSFTEATKWETLEAVEAWISKDGGNWEPEEWEG